MPEPTPVLIVTFNRPTKFKTLLEKCRELGVRKIYVAIDGGQSDDIQSQYDSTIIDFAKHYDGDLFILHRKTNLGLATSVMSAVDLFFEKEIQGIVLEDDLDFGREFLEYCDDALRKFADDKRISMISGNQFFPHSNSQSDITFGNYPLIWGWATWKDRWQSFRKTLEDNTIFQTPYWMPSRVKYFWLIGLKRAINCETNSWAIVFATYNRFRQLICIYPVQNLVSNIGDDSSATHTSDSHWTLNLPRTQKQILDLDLDNAISQTEMIERNVYDIGLKHSLFYFVYAFDRVFNKQKLVNKLSLRIKLSSSEEFCKYV